METLESQVVVIPPASVRLNPSRDSDWARSVLTFVEKATSEGKTVTVVADERLYSPQEAAEAAHVSRMTIQRRIEDGTIKAFKKGSHWRIRKSDLDSYRDRMWAETAAVMANDF
ncbi:MAG: helix-turn-helix domain-containing protein [Propionibacteriaceae bacterium]|jgi:excisionase family DNA binding protein|nr:helix-turn-helix domain-containing protein [Propionibacteriaceae bacterium]